MTLHTLRSTLLRLVREKIPFFVLVALSCFVTFVVQKRGGALELNEYLPLGARVGNALISYDRYLGKLFWPTDPAVFYPHPGQWPLGQVLLAGGLLPGLSTLVWMERRRHPFLLLGVVLRDARARRNLAALLAAIARSSPPSGTSTNR